MSDKKESSIGIHIPREKEAEIRAIAERKGVTLARLFLNSVEKKYGIEFSDAK